MGRRAGVVRWRPAIDDDVRAQLFCYLSPKSKKRPAAAISPNEGGGDAEDQGGRPSRRPMVAIQPPRTERPPLTFHYTFGGRAGKYIIPSNVQAIDARRLQENLLSFSSKKENSERASHKAFTAQEFGPVSYWVPNGIVGVTKSELTRLKKTIKHY